MSIQLDVACGENKREREKKPSSFTFKDEPTEDENLVSSSVPYFRGH